MIFTDLSHDIMEMIWNEKVKIEKLDKVEKSAKKQFPRVLNELNLINPPITNIYGQAILGAGSGESLAPLIFAQMKKKNKARASRINELKERFFESPMGEMFYIILSRGYIDLPLHYKFSLRKTAEIGYGGIKIPKPPTYYPRGSAFYSDSESESEEEDPQDYIDFAVAVAAAEELADAQDAMPHNIIEHNGEAHIVPVEEEINEAENYNDFEPDWA